MIAELVGRWVIINDEDGEHYQVGRVVAADDDFAVVDVRPPPHGRKFSRLIFLMEMSEDGRVLLFDSEADLDAWVAWADAPNEKAPKVVKMERPH